MKEGKLFHQGLSKNIPLHPHFLSIPDFPMQHQYTRQASNSYMDLNLKNLITEGPVFSLSTFLIALTRSPTVDCFNLVLRSIISKAKSGLDPCTAQLIRPTSCRNNVCSVWLKASYLFIARFGSIFLFLILAMYADWSIVIQSGSWPIWNPI